MGRWLGRTEVLDLPGVETIGYNCELPHVGTGNGTQVLWKISTIFLILSTIFPALKQILEEAFKKIKVVLFVAYDGDRF